MKAVAKLGVAPPLRGSTRVHSLREITVSYEGRDEQIFIRPPDLSTTGMFINTGHKFAEGTVLNVRFKLELTGAEVRTRGEVRYCLPGVGIGVEFVGISEDAVHIIEREVALNQAAMPKVKGPRLVKKKPRRKKK